MSTTRKPNTALRNLRSILSHAEPSALNSIRKRALALLAELADPVRLGLPAHLRHGETIDDIEANLALAYVDILLTGTEPQPSPPVRDDDRPVEPRELLAEAFLAVLDRDLPAYQRALRDLTTLAERGWMLNATDLETAR